MVETKNTYTGFMTLKNQRYSVDRLDYSVPSGDQSLFVRELVPFRKVSNHFVLFVHGLTFPSLTDFDLPVKDHSITQYFAERGLNCCIFDLRGYGKSTKPDCVTMEDRLEDIHTMYQHLLENRGAESVSLVGLSSGCNMIVKFLEKYSARVRDVSLLGACYLKNDFIVRNTEKLQLLKIKNILTGKWKTPYVEFSRKSLKRRLIEGEEQLLDRASVARFIEDAIGYSEKEREKLSSPIMPFFDSCKNTAYLEPLFKVDHIRVPTIVIRGENDEICCRQSAVALYNALACTGVETEIYTHENTKHDIHLYKNCESLFSRLFAFLTKNREA